MSNAFNRWTRLAFALGALPLLIYPFVLLAGVMSLAGHRTGNEPTQLIIVSTEFLVGSIAYPAVYIACLITAFSTITKTWSAEARAWISLLPLIYLSLLMVLMVAWDSVERGLR